ncbi:tail assembly chaperone [Aeromonas sobria]|uniref:Phage tail protein n=1 Tax=Aeromonas sobria TaxID=646 RepID=A0A1S2CWG1_AERSO|nr:tail assembly chaperone [Aeromonas sobria]MBS4688582.1 tail assembly chaperone [Aeromonas sobria]OHY92469.1 hypothetical protein BJD16_13380 [Aeromonas sobria]
MLYSKSKNGFYNQAVHSGSIPADAVEISDLLYHELLMAQEAGAIITSDENGCPIAVNEELDQVDVAFNKLNSLQAIAVAQIELIKPAVDGGYAKPEHTQLLADWQRYRYELTQVPAQPGWPESSQWPTEPEKVI